MANQIIIFCDSLNEYIAPRIGETYQFETGHPRKQGDMAIIRVNGERRRVILVRVHNTVRPGWWLVDRGPA